VSDVAALSLPLIPPLAASESFRSYTGRLADVNFIQAALRPFMTGLQKSTEALDQVSVWARLDPAVLGRRITAVQVDGQGRIRLGADLLPPSRVHLQSRKVCPQCMAENPAAPCAWDLKDYTVCHRHGVQLVQQCDNCHDTLGWQTAPADRCLCGRALRDMPSKPGTEEASKLSARLARAVDISLAHKGATPCAQGVGAVLIAHDVFRHLLLERLEQDSDRKERSAVRQCAPALLLTALYDDVYLDAIWSALQEQFDQDAIKVQMTLLAGAPTARHFRDALPSLDQVPLPVTPWRSSIPLHLRNTGGRRRFAQARSTRQIVREIGATYQTATALGWQVPLDQVARYRSLM